MKNSFKIPSYEFLEFDSTLFGYKVAKINDLEIDNKTFQILKKKLLAEDIKLAYWAIDPNNLISNFAAIENKGLLVDEKITFTKIMKKDVYEKDSKIISYIGRELNENLIRLALQSGEYSRFKIDKGFINNEFEKLYTKWIESSLKGVIAKDVLIYVEDNTEAGLITIGEKNEKADIGILAVDEKFRGKSIGTKLIHAVFSLTQKYGFDKIQVVTQKKNNVACNFYERVGFKMEKVENIYHFWLI